jgi:methylthioribulose-1-phosphate dehydratase
LSKREYENHKRTVEFRGFELQKALPGVTSHETTLSVPLFPNSQDMVFLAGELENTLLNRDCCFLLAGHGLYAWGKNLQETRRIIEAVEELCRYLLYKENRL